MIRTQDIQTILELMELKVEACGFLLFDDKELDNILYIDSISNDASASNEKRASCTLSKYTEIIWHTHPFNHKSYPSTEDILKILKIRKDNLPKISLIFTNWGIWQLYAGKKDYIIINLDKYIQKELDRLYFNTQKGRAKFDLLIQNQIDTFIKNIEELCEKYELHIKFTSWKEVENGYVIT